MPMRSLRTKMFFFLVPTLILSACPSSCPSQAPSKADYIQVLDTRCTELVKRYKGEEKQLKELFARDPAAAIPVLEKITADSKRDNDVLRDMKRPTEDEATLTDFWKELYEGFALGDRYVPILKRAVDLAQKMHNGTDAEKQEAQTQIVSIQKEMREIENALETHTKVLDGIARKYGFKICSVKATGFSGESRSPMK